MSHLPSPRGVRTSLVALATALALTGCAGDEPAAAEDPAEATDSPSIAISEEPEPTDDGCTTTEAAADQAVGSGYAFDAPEGWDDATAAMQQMFPQGDLAYADQTDVADGFGDNVNVIVSEGTGLTELDPVRDQLADELASIATGVEPREDREVGCAPAIQQSAAGDQQGIAIVFDQLAVLRKGDLYVVTFTHTADTADDVRQDAVDTVLDSWRWTNAG
ncbi:MAG: hypothetical protein Q8O56_13625 [Solirubrobacteraceae bacterium]|nr:hypothetical protein [Solirubrobacteraceae bacterium]